VRVAKETTYRGQIGIGFHKASLGQELSNGRLTVLPLTSMA
jgi:hypothetical protein